MSSRSRHKAENNVSKSFARTSINRKEGFMEKKTGLLHMWRNRYFVLMHDVLSYFKREDQKESMTPTGRVFFGDIQSIEKIVKRSRPFCFLIHEDGKKHLMSCSSEIERDSWIDAIESAKEHHAKQEKFDPVRRKSARIGREFKRVTIQKDEKGGIGCTIKNVGGAIFVNRIIPDGPVAISGVLRPGDQIIDINGIRISGSPIEKIKDVIRQSPDYLVCTVKPVTHYANNQDASPELGRTAYTEIDPKFLKSLSDEDEDEAHSKSQTPRMYENIDYSRRGEKPVQSDEGDEGEERVGGQNYAELDFTRR
eukprot:gene11988-13226_t